MFDLEQLGLDEDELKQRVPAIVRQQQQNSEPSPSAPAQVLSSALSSPPIRKPAPVINPDATAAPHAPAYARPAATLSTPGQAPAAPKIPSDNGIDAQRLMRDAGLGPDSVIQPPASGFGKPGQTVPDLIQKRAQASQPLIPQGAPVPKQYRMGTGTRILAGITDAALGFTGHGNDAIYFGPGATNNQYERDTATQKSTLGNLDKQITEQRGSDDESRKMYADAVKAAYEGRIADARDTAAQATQQWRGAQKENANTRQQMEQEKNSPVTYDAKSGRFMKNGSVYSPKTIEEGASLEAANGVSGKYSTLWGQERKNQPITINNRDRKLSAKEQLLLNARAKATGKSVDDLSEDEIDQVLAGERGPKGGSKPKDFTKDKEQAEKTKNAELSRLEKDFSRDFAKAEDDQERDRLTKALNQNKARVQREYDQQASTIGQGEAEARGQNRAAPAQAPAASAPAQNAYPLKESGGHKAGETVKLKNGKSVKITGFNSKGQFSYDEQQAGIQ